MSAIDIIGDRMKKYESVPKTFLTNRMPSIVRLRWPRVPFVYERF